MKSLSTKGTIVMEEENIKQMISMFLEQKTVDFALLINGVWGSGKTYFIHNSLGDILKHAKLSPIYVSLNGVRAFVEVAAQIVFGSNLDLTKTASKSFILPFGLKYLPEKSVSAFISVLQKMEEKKSQGWLNWLKTKNDLSPQKHVIILDDLERITNLEENLVTIMGRVFDEFISRGYHVIFVCDESRIAFEKYAKEKEKYIRRTVRFKQNIDSVIDMIVSTYKGVELRHAKLCCNDLKRFARLYEIDNIRTLKRILDDFIFLSGKVDDAAVLSNIARVLFYNMAPIANELSSGRLNAYSADDVSSLKNVEVQRYAVQAERLYNMAGHGGNKDHNKINKPSSYAKEFIDRYDDTLPIRWIPCEVVMSYEIDGFVDAEQLNKIVHKWLPETVDKYRQSLNIIWDVGSIDDAQFAANYPIVIEGLEKGMYSAEWVVLACELFAIFAERKWLSVDCASLIKIAAQALKARWSKYSDDYINPMVLHNRHEDFMQPIIDIIQYEVDRREDRSINDDVAKFLVALSTNDKETAWLFFPQGQPWLIFDKIVKAGKCKEFCGLSNWALALVSENLKQRGPFIRPSSRSAIEQIAHELEISIGMCDPRKMPLRKARLEDLKARFSEVLKSPEFQQAKM